MTHMLLIIGAIYACAGYTDQRSERPATLAELGRRADVICPAAAELKWKRIPWLTDLAEAQRTAQREKRPIFLWVTGDDPLERC